MEENSNSREEREDGSQNGFEGAEPADEESIHILEVPLSSQIYNIVCAIANLVGRPPTIIARELITDGIISLTARFGEPQEPSDFSDHEDINPF